MNAPTRDDIRIAIARGKAEILADMAAGRVPATITDFSDLHDYVDANEYGGLCEEPSVWVDPEAEVTIAHAADAANEVQNALHEWLVDLCHCAHPIHAKPCTGTGADLDPEYRIPADEPCICPATDLALQGAV